MKIKIEGSLKLRGNFTVELDMTEEEFDTLPRWMQEQEIESVMDWENWLDNSELDDLDIDDIEKVSE